MHGSFGEAVSVGGNTKGSRRRFGSVRRLPSGRWQARYQGSDGLPRKAPSSFETKRDAERWLVETEAEMLRGDWTDPERGKVRLDEYVARWVKERDLKARTRDEYERHVRLYIAAQIGNLALADITPGQIRAWRAGLLDDGVGRATVAKTYRILHAVLATAADDGLIRRNPCRVKGGGQHKSEERPTASIAQVLAIADAIDPRYRLFVLLATFAQLRFGELVALRRNSIDLGAMELRVRRATAELTDGTQLDDDPKSEAGRRPISLPLELRPDVERHLAEFAEPGPTGRLFVGRLGGIPRRRNFNRVWKKALDGASVSPPEGLHLHDLRHTGSTWSAQTGATLKEVMARIGHSSPRAAMVYQHASRERDRAIADALDVLLRRARGEAPEEDGR
jgi:integrase